MKNDLKYIDEFYKSKLKGHQEATETIVWDRLKWSLFWMRHKWAIGLSSIVLLVGLGSAISYPFIFTNSNLTDNNTNSNSQIILAVNETSTQDATYKYKESPIKTPVLIKKAENKLNGIAVHSTLGIEILKSKSTANQSGFENTENEFSEENNRGTNDVYFRNDILEMNALEFEYSLVNKPDTTLLGYNLRSDILPPGTRKQWFSVNVYAGPSYSESNITGVNSEYLAFRNSNESGNPGWSVGSDLRLHIKKWIISSGVNYSVYNQKRSYVDKYQEYSPENSYFDYDTTWVWIFDAPNYGTQMLKKIDSSWVEVYDDITIDNSGISQIKYFEIPILVGYQFNTNMFAFEINAGASVGFLTYSNFKVPDFSNNSNIIVADQISKTMFNFVANASFYYHLNRRSSLFISPYFKQNMQSVFDQNYPVNQRMKTYGLNFGVNICF